MKITLRSARVNANMTQQQVAEALGVTPTVVGQWEKGRQLPRVDKALQLCELYGVTVQDINF